MPRIGARDMARHAEVVEELAALQIGSESIPVDRSRDERETVPVDDLFLMASQGLQCLHRRTSGRVICSMHESCDGESCIYEGQEP